MEKAIALSSPPLSAGRFHEGQVIGNKYRLVRLLDEGGMGAVWVAHNQDLDIPVAIKLIRTEAQSPETTQRLANEARILARLGHSAILKVYDFGKTEEDDPYIVMELLHGECLDEALYTRGKLDALWAVQLLLPVADGLWVAHERGIVHRDLKPANIFLANTLSGYLQPKILDFGIAQAAHDGDTRLTRDGTLMGSPVYMAPEQARGRREVDQRVDVWAFCVVLYEAITGEIPFDGDDYFDVLRAIVENEPMSTVDLCAGDRALWDIISRGLQKDPALRWQSMREIGVALAQWLLSHGVTEDAGRASLYATWLSPDSTPPASSFPPVTTPPSSRPMLHSTPQVRTLTPDELSGPRERVLGRSPGRRLSTGGHGALSVPAPRSRTISGGGPRLAAAVGALVLMGIGVLAWVLGRPSAEVAKPQAADLVVVDSAKDFAAASAQANQAEPDPEVAPAAQKTTDGAAPPQPAAEPPAPRPRAAETTPRQPLPASASTPRAAPPRAAAPALPSRREYRPATKGSRTELKSPF